MILLHQAGLQPNDDITVHYGGSDELVKVIGQQHDFISATIKQPLVCDAPSAVESPIIAKTMEVRVITTSSICHLL